MAGEQQPVAVHFDAGRIAVNRAEQLLIPIGHGRRRRAATAEIAVVAFGPVRFLTANWSAPVR
jgi:hypothetical protein